MKNSAIKIDFRPRTNLTRSLEYRPHIKWMYRGYIASAFVLLGLSFLSAYDVAGTRGASAALQVFCLELLFPVIIYLQGYFLLRPLAFTKVNVNSDELTIEKFGKTLTLKYDEIESVRFFYVPYTGGRFSLITRSGKRFRFTAVLERSDYILEMVASFNPQLISPKQIENYRRTAILVDHSWGRFYSAFNWPKLMLKYAGYPMVLTTIWFLISSSPAKFGMAKMFSVFLVFASANAVIGLALWGFTEAFLMIKGRSKMIADPNQSIRPVNDENKVSRVFAIAHYALTFACFVGLLI